MATYIKNAHGSGNISFTARIRLKGYPPLNKNFENLKSAKKWATNQENKMRMGRFEPEIISSTKTIGELISEYEETILSRKDLRPNYVKNTKIQLNWWKSQIGLMLISQINIIVLNGCLEIYAGKGYSKKAPGTINRYLNALSMAFNYGIKNLGWITENPVNMIDRLKENERSRYLSEKERNDLIAQCEKEKKPVKLFVVLSIATGGRKNEIYHILRKNIIHRVIEKDGKKVEYATIILSKDITKNKQDRQVVIHGYPYKLLKEYLEETKFNRRFLFQNFNAHPMNMDNEIRRCLNRAKIEDFHPHDLRHTHASYLGMNGASLLEIKESLGQKSEQMAKRYSHIAKSHIQNLVTDMTDVIFNQSLPGAAH